MVVSTGLTQLRRGVLEYCVMAVLRDEQRYGFELVKALSGDEGLLTSEGTIYPLLARLRREGLVTSVWGESPSGPPRRYYRLTDDGHVALQRFTREWASFRDAVDHLLEQRMTG